MPGILFLAHRVPYPPDRGDKMRSYHLLRHIAARAPVHLVTFADDAADMAHAEVLRPIVASLHVERRTRSTPLAAMVALASRRPVSLAAFDSPRMRRAVAQLIGDVDGVFAFSGQMAQFVPRDCPRPFVMDFVDMDSAKFEAYSAAAAFPIGWMHAREARLLAGFEAQTARRADISLFVSEAEARLFRDRARLADGRVAALGNGIDLSFYDPAAEFARIDWAGRGPLIVFTGQMDYRPNVEAVTLFARETMPAILKRVPAARFAIVGRAPTAAVRALGGLPGVDVIGSVSNVRSWIAAADVVVAPLRLARGIQNKVLEAMAMARAVVASPAAFEGIDAVDGRDLIVAKAGGEAQTVIALLADAERRTELGAAARARMVSRYAWDAALAPLGDMLELPQSRGLEAAA
jgi:sugar transferase (PEP-CTERM/EpsH1 system associated)